MADYLTKENIEPGKEFIEALDFEFLEHHGIKGQKWGERNYQYEDGSLTPAGRLRYGADPSKNTSIKTQVAIQKNVDKKVQKAQAKKQKAAEKAAKEKQKTMKRQAMEQKKSTKKAEQERKAQEKFERDKKEILKDPAKVYKNFDRLTTDEINNALKRFDLQKKLSDADKNKMERGANYLQTLVKYSSSGIALYNNVARTANAFTDMELPYVPNVPGDAGKKTNKK